MSHSEIDIPSVDEKLSPISYNAMAGQLTPEGKLQLEHDKTATREYFLQTVNPNTVFFHNLKEKLDYLVENDYYDSAVLDMYDFSFVKELFKQAYAFEFRFPTYIGAVTFYTTYALKTFDGERWLERFEDRVVMTALWTANGDMELAKSLVDEMMSSRFQPATPTFLNAGRKQRGEPVSCFLMGVEDSMEAISRAITNALQLSKRGGGVALNLTNIREQGAPIKKVKGVGSGIIPVMKLLEDSFAYANQLGARKGAGAVYLNVHHPDILSFLDTKRENADESVRIKSLSIGVVVPDITFELAKRDEEMYLFSPYDVERLYGKGFTEFDVSEMYYEWVNNPGIRKKKISARDLFETIAKLQFESGYPYILFEGNANRGNPIDGRISFSNLCSEILQVNTTSTFNEDGTYKHVGKDISCNLGSLNIAKAFDSPDFAKTVETSMRALSAVSDLANIKAVPPIERGNKSSHAVGLGAMNLHGFLGREHIFYDSPEAVDFTNMYFYSVTYHALLASNKMARERNEVFEGFEKSKYADGTYFDKYIEKDWSQPETEKVRELLKRTTMYIPTVEDWKKLRDDVMEYGIYNQNLQAVPPTGSISYINNSTSSIHPIASRVERRKTGSIGAVYYPQPHMNNENLIYFQDAFEIGQMPVLRIYQAAGQHVDQGLSLTMFYSEEKTSNDVWKAIRRAHKMGIKTFYYARYRQEALKGTEIRGLASNIRIGAKELVDNNANIMDEDGDVCVSCML